MVLPEITHLETLLFAAVVFFPLGVWLGPKVLDWWNGVPKSARTAMKTLEGSVFAELKAVEADTLNHIHHTLGLPAPIPVAPVVPAPVVVPASAAPHA